MKAPAAIAGEDFDAWEGERVAAPRRPPAAKPEGDGEARCGDGAFATGSISHFQ